VLSSSTPSSGSTYLLSFTLPDDAYGAFIVAATKKGHLQVRTWDVKPGKAPGSDDSSSTARDHYQTLHPVRPSKSTSSGYPTNPTNEPIFHIGGPDPHTLHPVRPSLPPAPTPDHKQDEEASTAVFYLPGAQTNTLHPVRPTLPPSPEESSSAGLGHMIYYGLGGKESSSSSSSSSSSIMSYPTVTATGGNSTYGSNATVTAPTLVIQTASTSGRVGVANISYAIVCLIVALWLS
jgi:hypothetical protein